MSGKRDRWERLVKTLADNGVDVRLDEKVYQGRKTMETGYGITVKGAGILVTVIDQWRWDNWAGWRVTVEDLKTNFVVKQYPLTKKRGQVATYVKDRL